MTPSKRIFIIVLIAFFLFLAWLIYDISSRTTFPGSKKEDRALMVSPSETVRRPIWQLTSLKTPQSVQGSSTMRYPVS